MYAIAEALADLILIGAYLALPLALLILPLVLVWLWYSRRARAGTVDRPMLVRVELATPLWMVAGAAALGFLMWADNTNGAAG